MCGRITAYQVGTTDSFLHRKLGGLDGIYVDGISLTHGNPRQHIWTFASALDEVGTITDRNCPFIDNSSSVASSPPAFVGGDFFCDTGSEEHVVDSYFYGNDPLWDGAGCGPLNTCCLH